VLKSAVTIEAKLGDDDETDDRRGGAETEKDAQKIVFVNRGVDDGLPPNVIKPLFL